VLQCVAVCVVMCVAVSVTVCALGVRDGSCVVTGDTSVRGTSVLRTLVSHCVAVC